MPTVPTDQFFPTRVPINRNLFAVSVALKILEQKTYLRVTLSLVPFQGLDAHGLEIFGNVFPGEFPGHGVWLVENLILDLENILAFEKGA